MSDISITDFIDFNPKRVIKRGEVAPFVDMAALPVDSRDITAIGEREFKGGGSRFMNGDTLFARITPCLENGKTAKVSNLPDNTVASGSTEFIVMAAKEPEYDEDYVYYLARLPEFRVYAQARMEGTSGRQRVSWQSLTEFKFPFPDKNTRKGAGLLLKKFDDKIELNRQTNQTLEQIAQAIFKSWFVDFEPTRAKIIAKEQGADLASQELAAQAIICGAITLEQLQGYVEESVQKSAQQREQESLSTRLQKAINEKLSQPNPTGITPDQLKVIAALFPNVLVESELGALPASWEVLGFKNIVEKNIDNRGKTPPTKESGIPLLEVKHLPEGSIKPDLNTTKYVDEETYATWFRAHLEPEDIIISTVGTIGRICMVPKGEKMTIAQNLLGMRFDRNKVSPYFMYYQMNGFRFRHDVDARLVITVQASIKRKDLETIDLLVPSIAIQNEFEKIVKPLALMQQSNQSLALEELRDTLLPKLLSGEIDVSALADNTEANA